MTTFSNKVLYTKGHLSHHSIILQGTSSETEKKFTFKEPIKNVIAIEAVQGALWTTTTSDKNLWYKIRCPTVEKRLEGKMGTEYDTPLALVNANVPFALCHSVRYFSKPKDSVGELEIAIEPIEGQVSSLDSNWIIELDITTVRVATHADWRNIPTSADVAEESGQKFDKVRDDLHSNFKNPLVTSVTKRKPKEKKKPKPTDGANQTSLSNSTVLKGSVGALGLGTALALGLKFK